jgi:hypothetical protein
MYRTDSLYLQIPLDKVILLINNDIMTKKLLIILDYQASYENYLVNQKYDILAVKSLLNDLSNCFDWLIMKANNKNISQNVKVDLNIFLSYGALEQYLKYLKENFDHQDTNRIVAAIKSFTNFAVEMKWLTSNPIEKLTIKSTNEQKVIDEQIKLFSLYLTQHNLNKKTLKHYTNDINEYLTIISSN